MLLSPHLMDGWMDKIESGQLIHELPALLQPATASAAEQSCLLCVCINRHGSLGENMTRNCPAAALTTAAKTIAIATLLCGHLRSGRLLWHLSLL